MDELTFISGCVLAGMVANKPEACSFTDDLTLLVKRVRTIAEVALPLLGSGSQLIDVSELFDPDPPPPVAAISERDALSGLSAIIEAVDVAGWQTQEAKDDADVVSWVRDMAVERDRLKQLYHNKCIDAAQDAAENEVLKSRNAELKARQVRLLAALARAVAVVRYVAKMERPKDYEGTAHWQELIELIDLLKLECKPDEAADG